VEDVEFIAKYSSEQRLISFSENVSDLGNAVSTYDTIRYIICTEKPTGKYNLAHELKENLKCFKLN